MNGEKLPVKALRVAGGFVGHYRLDWRTEWWPVMEKGNPLIRLSIAEAERDAWAAKYRVEHPIIYGAQFFTKSARAKAEALFKGV